jgi:glycoprotein 6-alpha-L-fucosyltransferase
LSNLRIHVRRTDKRSEAAFHDVSEYMKYVEDYYIIYQYQNPNVNFTKRVYLATDEPTVFEDIRTKYEGFEIFREIFFFCIDEYRYPDYIVHGDIAIAQSAQLNSRYGTESLKGLLLDIHFLSLCDYLVCTLSSQVKGFLCN